jgi:hypothetical protein
VSDVDEQWLREWSADECDNPPKTLRQDVGALLAQLAALRAVADAAEALRIALNEDIRAYNIAEDERLALVTALDALLAEALTARARTADQETTG